MPGTLQKDQRLYFFVGHTRKKKINRAPPFAAPPCVPSEGCGETARRQTRVSQPMFRLKSLREVWYPSNPRTVHGQRLSASPRSPTGTPAATSRCSRSGTAAAAPSTPAGKAPPARPCRGRGAPGCPSPPRDAPPVGQQPRPGPAPPPRRAAPHPPPPAPEQFPGSTRPPEGRRAAAHGGEEGTGRAGRGGDRTGLGP